MSRSFTFSSLAVVSTAIWLLTFTPASATENSTDPRRPPSIQTEEVPPVPTEIFGELREFQNIRNAQFLGWSPDGTTMIVLTRFGNAAQLHRVYQPGGRREQITFHDEPVMAARFLPKSDAILFVMSQGGNENDQVYRLETKNFSTRLLTDGKSRHQFGPVNADGSKMVVHSNVRNGRDTDLYSSTRRPASRSCFSRRRTNSGRSTIGRPMDASLLMSRYVSINEGYPALFDLEDEEEARYRPA